MEFKKPSEEEWDSFMLDNQHSWINCLSSWMNFFEKKFGYKNLSFGAYENNELIALVPLFSVKSILFGNRIISGPVLDNGGIFANKEIEKEKIRQITDKITEIGKDYDFIEIRNPPFSIESFEKSSKYSDFVLELNKENDLIMSFDKKLRNGIRKAEKLVSVERMSIKEGLNDFYKMHVSTMKFLQSPPFAKSFYEQMAETNGFILFAKHEGKIIASILVNYFRTDAKYEAAVYIPKYRDLQANSLLVYKALLFSKEDGMKRFFFGRTVPEGTVYEFKKRWNAKEFPIDYYYKVFKGKIPEDARKSKLSKLSFIWKIAPSFLTKLFGNYFRKKLAM